MFLDSLYSEACSEEFVQEKLEETYHMCIVFCVSDDSACISVFDYSLNFGGFEPNKTTVWILEGILYYLSHSNAMKVLKIIAENCNRTKTVLLVDFMNKQATALSSSTFHFYCDWPDELLPSLGFAEVTLSQIGDPDAHFGDRVSLDTPRT